MAHWAGIHQNLLSQFSLWAELILFKICKSNTLCGITCMVNTYLIYRLILGGNPGLSNCFLVTLEKPIALGIFQAYFLTTMIIDWNKVLKIKRH